jgi:CheY-like chemotaxis protein
LGRAASSQKVLLVDADADSGELLAFIVERAGHASLIARSALDAVDAAREFRPHVAFIDISLPDMSGYALVTLLRAPPEIEGCRFVAFTGHCGPEAVTESLAAGFDAHVTKPARAEELLAEIRPGRPLSALQ